MSNTNTFLTSPRTISKKKTSETYGQFLMTIPMIPVVTRTPMHLTMVTIMELVKAKKWSTTSLEQSTGSSSLNSSVWFSEQRGTRFRYSLRRCSTERVQIWLKVQREMPMEIGLRSRSLFLCIAVVRMLSGISWIYVVGLTTRISFVSQNLLTKLLLTQLLPRRLRT